MPSQEETFPPFDGKPRCPWCLSHPLYVAYHDEEWGRPVHDERKLFEMLILEGAQAGLSWLTILKRRQAYRSAYADWDPHRVARFGKRDVARLLAPDSGIIRNRLKVAASINNARRFLAVQKEFGSFDRYVWSFTGGRTLRSARPPAALKDIPSRTVESDAMSADLRRRGFRFVGSVICYSFMQACGLADDHMKGCFRCVTDGRGV